MMASENGGMLPPAFEHFINAQLPTSRRYVWLEDPRAKSSSAERLVLWDGLNLITLLIMLDVRNYKCPNG